MARLFTLAFPTCPENDLLWLEAQRRLHDALTAQLVPAHVTLAFGTEDLPAETYCAHVADRAAREAAIDLHFSRVVPGNDHRDARGYVFVVPDEPGGEALRGLFERLNTGPLAAGRRPDIPFIPHITLGQMHTLAAARALSASLAKDFRGFPARIVSLSVVSVEGDKAACLASFPLEGAIAPALNKARPN